MTRMLLLAMMKKCFVPSDKKEQKKRRLRNTNFEKLQSGHVARWLCNCLNSHCFVLVEEFYCTRPIA